MIHSMKDQGHVKLSYISILYEILHTGTNTKIALQKTMFEKICTIRV